MERITLRSSSHSIVDTITILVVDDDTTCLSIVAAILKKFRYEVVTVKHPNDALCTLRIKEFDLVVSDVHMPDMNGFELQEAIAQEFNLPVVLMSADDEEGIALKGLEKGAAFFIVKPVSAEDLRDLWQFASMKRTSSQVLIQEESDQKKAISGESATSDQTVNKRKSPQKEGSTDNISSTKKPKVVWTNSLHNRFLEAIRSIGLDRAVPKKILEVMNVPGLTRENVASHLQKYRIFLRRVSDASFKIQYSASVEKGGLNRNLTSSALNQYSFSNTETSGFGQSRLLSNRGGGYLSWPKPNSTLSTCRPPQNDYHTPSLAKISLEDVLSFPAAPVKEMEDHKTNYVGYSLHNLSNSKLGNHTTYDHHLTPDSSGGGGLLADIINCGGGGGGDQLRDVIEEYGMLLMDSNPPLVSDDQQQLNIMDDSPIFDISELDIISTPNQPLHQLGTDVAFTQHHLNIQPNNGCETSTNSNFYGSLTPWDNHVLSFDQSTNQHQNGQHLMSSLQGPAADSSCNFNQTVALPINEPQAQVYGELSSAPIFGTSSSQLSKTTVAPLIERDDDEFLEYLLAPFAEDQTPEGLI